jgi:hypothetical protein
MPRTEQVERVGCRLQSMGRHRAPRGLVNIGMFWLPVELGATDFNSP